MKRLAILISLFLACGVCAIGQNMPIKWLHIYRYDAAFTSIPMPDITGIEQLDTEDQMLLKRTYDSFARSGANLEGKDRDEYKALCAELSKLSLNFEQNTVKATAEYEMWLKADDLKGLPESQVSAAALAAKELK